MAEDAASLPVDQVSTGETEPTDAWSAASGCGDRGSVLKTRVLEVSVMCQAWGFVVKEDCWLVVYAVAIVEKVVVRCFGRCCSL